MANDVYDPIASEDAPRRTPVVEMNRRTSMRPIHSLLWKRSERENIFSEN